MRSFLLRGVAAATMVLAAGAVSGSADAASVTYNFSYTQGPTTYNIGTVTLSTAAASPDSMLVTIAGTPGQPAASANFQITGVAFAFSPNQSGLAVSNPGGGGGMGTLNWVKLNNLNPIPNPANSSTVTKDDFEYGVTEGNASNFNPPGVGPGQSDAFILGSFDLDNALFEPAAWAALDIADLVDHIGIRVQSLDSSVNSGSLFLVGAPQAPTGGPPISVPEPATMALLGAGLFGLGLARRRRRV